MARDAVSYGRAQERAMLVLSQNGVKTGASTSLAVALIAMVIAIVVLLRLL